MCVGRLIEKSLLKKCYLVSFTDHLVYAKASAKLLQETLKPIRSSPTEVTDQTGPQLVLREEGSRAVPARLSITAVLSPAAPLKRMLKPDFSCFLRKNL